APIKKIGPAAIPELIQLLPGPKSKTNSQPEIFLKTFGKEATPALLDALAKDKKPAVRQAVAGILRGPVWGEPKDIIPGLVRALGDKDEQVRRAASVSIRSYRQDAQPFLEEALRGKDEALRLEAVQLLGQLGLSAKSSSKALLAMLKEE